MEMNVGNSFHRTTFFNHEKVRVYELPGFLSYQQLVSVDDDKQWNMRGSINSGLTLAAASESSKYTVERME